MAIQTKVTGLSEYGQYMKVLLCGNPGTGKTLMSSTFPNPYFISAEGGLMSIARRFLPFGELENSDDLREMLKHLRQEPEVRAQMLGVPEITGGQQTRVDTIVIDTLDEVQKIFMRERTATTGKDSFILQDYGWLRERMEGAIRAFRNLPMNVVFTCHLKEDKDEEIGSISYQPALAGQSANYIPGAVDLAFVLLSRVEATVVDGKPQKDIVRFAQTYGDSKFPWAKDRSGRLPHELPINFTDDYNRLFDAIYGGIDDEFAKIAAEKNHQSGLAPDQKPRPDPYEKDSDPQAAAEAEAFAKELRAKQKLINTPA